METAGQTVGDVLSYLDEQAEKSGSIITGIRFGGKQLEADEIPALADYPASVSGLLELVSIPVHEMKTRALETLLGILSVLAAGSQAADGSDIRKDLRIYRETYEGLHSGEELSVLDHLSTAAASGKDSQETMQNAIRFFQERLTEVQDPVYAMESARSVFEAIRQDISDVPVRLQTGRESEGLKTMVLVIELINKTVRILPGFLRSMDWDSGFSIQGQELGSFYGSFNDVLRELVSAFEHKDFVLIGDLAEYEILPRLDLFFDAIQSRRTL